MHDKPQTFLTVVDKTSVHRQVLHGVAIRVRSFEFTTGAIVPTFIVLSTVIPRGYCIATQDHNVLVAKYVHF